MEWVERLIGLREVALRACLEFWQAKKWWLLGCSVVLGAALLGVGIWWWEAGQRPQEVVKVLSDRDIKEDGEVVGKDELEIEPTKEADTTEIWVDVSGAVVKPGLLQLPVGVRVAEALEQAGGFNDWADREYVSQVLNLAIILEDGDKIYIPTRMQVLNSMPTPVPLLTEASTEVSLLTRATDALSEKSTQLGNDDSHSAEKGDSEQMGRVNVNLASSADLDLLPGVGPVIAGKIIDGRPHESIEGLCEVINNSRTCDGLVDLIEF